MTFSQYAGIAIVPTLARLVLAAAFVSSGWNKIFTETEFTAEQATILRSYNVNVQARPLVVQRRSSDGTGPSVVHASFVQNAPVEPTAPAGLRVPPGTLPEAPSDRMPAATAPSGTASPGDAATAPGAIPPALPPPTTAATQPAGTPSTAPLPPGTYTAKRMHQITLLLHANNFPAPQWQAVVAAFTELVGGAMLLIGLFSRLWGLGLAIAMGVAFYLVSMNANHIFGMDPRAFALDIGRFNTAYVQLALFVLAFGVFLTGPGPLSLDRMLFGSPEGVDAGDAKID